jgi:hypothetical protein
MAVILPDAAGVVRIVHKGLLQGLNYVNTFHVRGSLGTYTEADMVAVATAMHTAYVNAFIPNLNTGTSLELTQAIDLTSRTGPVGVHQVRSVGTINTANLPSNQSAVCISWLITDRYRGGHPRMYLPLSASSDIQNGRTLTTAKLGLIDAAASGYLTSVTSMAIAGQTWEPVAVRYYSQGQLLGVPLQRAIKDAAVHSRVDSMRRRTGKELS